MPAVQLTALQQLRLAEVGNGNFGFHFHEDTKLPCLTYLQTLGQLHILPQTCLLTSLHSLEVSGPERTHQELVIHDYHVGITNLKQLALKNVEIGHNAGMIGFWLGLEELYVGDVVFQAEDFDSSWLTQGLPALRKLFIVRCDLVTFNVSEVTKHLVHLDLEGNLIERIPANLHTLTCLSFLDLSCQQQEQCCFRIVDSLTDWALAMPNLQYLDLSQQFGFEWDAESLYVLAALEAAFTAARQSNKSGELQFHWHTSTSLAG